MTDESLLREVSRSFYLTIRALPEEVRSTIALGYLLARASDSIADTSSASRALRIEALRNLREGSIDGNVLAELSAAQENPAERELVRALPDLLHRLTVSPDRSRLEWVWVRILRGQAFDLERFEGNRAPLSPAELDEYTYLVAGCVGEFWTRLCAARLRKFARRTPDDMAADAIRYGKGLQLVNILRDRSADAANGRVYVPPERFEEVRRECASHLDAGFRWVRDVNCARVRFACVIPLRIGRATLAGIGPDSGAVKISRRAVRMHLIRSLPAFWFRP